MIIYTSIAALLYSTIFTATTAVADTLASAARVAASGMAAQSQRMKVIAENIANANVTGSTPQDAPYRRKIIFFKTEFDEKAGAELVKIDRITYDYSKFELKYDPSHPAADNNGYVRYPNVVPVVELADSKEAQRSFEANVHSFEVTKSNQLKLLDLMK